MNKKWKRFIMLLVVILTVFSMTTGVMADDDHDEDEDDEKHEYYQESDDDDWEVRKNPITTEQQSEYWNIWSRKPRNNINNPLPISEPEKLTVIVDHNESSIYFIPKEGQLLVAGDAIAEFLGARAKMYSESEILVLTKDNAEVIVKDGSNAAFENRVKVPMPVQAMFYEKSVYLPVSVAANALGYRVSWDQNKRALIFESI